jgi:hypothetical protein
VLLLSNIRPEQQALVNLFLRGFSGYLRNYPTFMNDFDENQLYAPNSGQQEDDLCSIHP